MKDAHKTKAQLLTELAALRQQIMGIQTSTPEREQGAETRSSTPSFAQSALDALAATLAILDAHGTILAVNAAWRRFADANAFQGMSYGVGVNYLVLCDAATGVDSEAAATMAAGIRQVLAQQRDQFTLEYPCHSPDEQRWFLARVTCFEYSNTLYIVVTHDDITARRQAEDALSNSEERYRTLVEHTLQGISITRNGRRLFANPALATIFGYEDPQELIGKDVHADIDPHDQARVAEYRQARSRGEPAPTRYELQGVKQDGTRVWLENAVAAIPWEGAPATMSTVIDITGRKRAEQEMRRIDRLALIGQLTSGLAHEIGTPLNVISGNAELLRMELLGKGMPTDTVASILGQSDRITHLMERLLNFARAIDQPMEPLDLRQPLSNALQLIESRFRREGMIATLEVPAALPPVWGSASQLEQVFLNILVNAWQATTDGGKVTIQADVVDDRCVRIVFRDTGKGMAASALEHAFEPFFTTKMSAGTGLGLAICQQIIESYHGSIAMESTPGEGTTVTIDLLQAHTPHPRMTA